MVRLRTNHLHISFNYDQNSVCPQVELKVGKPLNQIDPQLLQLLLHWSFKKVVRIGSEFLHRTRSISPLHSPFYFKCHTSKVSQ